MANHISHAALPYPVKNARFTVLIPYLDADGDPTDPTTPDTEISKDNGTYADTAEEVTVAAGGRGTGMLTLTGAETDCSALALWGGVASGPKATLLTLSPKVLPVLYSGTASAGAAGSITLVSPAPAKADVLIGCIVKTTGGTGGGGTGGANNQARIITGYTSGRVASVVPNWETNPDSTTTYEVLLTPEAAVAHTISLLDAILAAATYATDTNTYQAKVWLVDDNGGSTDRYVVSWFKNGQPIFAGITSPTIQVIKASDGTDLIASTAMTEIGSTGLYKKDEGTNRVVDGAGYIAKIAATIDGSSRQWSQPISRDS